MKKVTIRPIVREDAEKIVAWRNRPDVNRNLYTQDELTVEQHLWYFDHIVCAGKVHQFIIQVSFGETKEDIGTVFLKAIDNNSSKAEFGIFIGDPSARGKGYAAPATSEILKYGFETLKLHRIYLTVMADNLPAISAYQRAGFVVEGTMKDDYLRDDKYVDVVMMGLTCDMWKK